MKRSFLALLSLLLWTPGLKAQCDNPFYTMKQGTRFVVENYNAKGKMESSAESTVTEYQTTPGGFIATILTKMNMEKGKGPADATYTMECRDGVMYLDMSGFVPQESMAAFGDMEVTVEMDKLEIPSRLSVGQKLDDGSITISTQNSPMAMSMKFTMTDRVVEGQESVTTPAGTFQCFKISYNTSSKIMMMNTSFKTVQYLAEGAGTVKTETYRSNGSLMGYSILTAYTP
jgi:hypothetical protein